MSNKVWMQPHVFSLFWAANYLSIYLTSANWLNFIVYSDLNRLLAQGTTRWFQATRVTSHASRSTTSSWASASLNNLVRSSERMSSTRPKITSQPPGKSEDHPRPRTRRTHTNLVLFIINQSFSDWPFRFFMQIQRETYSKGGPLNGSAQSQIRHLHHVQHCEEPSARELLDDDHA